MTARDFASPGLYVSWKPTDGLVAKARSLVGRASGVDALRAVYRFVTTIAYDHDKAKRLAGGRGYIPNPEQTFKAGTGVCSDKASLMCAMLRSVGIEAKFVVGTVDGKSHAWVLARVGSTWYRCDPTMAASWSADEMRKHAYVAKFER